MDEVGVGVGGGTQLVQSIALTRHRLTSIPADVREEPAVADFVV